MPRTAVNSQGIVVYNYSKLTDVVSDVWMDKVIEPRLIKAEKNRDNTKSVDKSLPIIIQL